MTGASKILTVSYGTFSCTLEGFDDPFGTMKAIAEYFRDLAAGDRYFGAEPPTPDAAMLHRIAEREIQRRVDAKIQENGIVLRAAEDSEPVAEAGGSKPVLAPAVLDAPAPAAETVADKLSRLRSEVAQQAIATAPVISFAMPEEDEGYDLPDSVGRPADVADALAQDDPPYEHTAVFEDHDTPFPEDLPEVLNDEPRLALPEDRMVEDAEIVDTPIVATPVDTDSLLAGLMANLSASSTASYAPPAPVVVPDGLELVATDDVVDAGTDAEASIPAVTDQTGPQPDGDDGFDLSNLTRQLEAEPAPAEANAAFGVDDDQAEVDQPTGSLLAMQHVDGADLPAAVEPPPHDGTGSHPDGPDEGEPDIDTVALRPDAAEKLQRARARVVRIRRLDGAAVPADAPAPAPAPVPADEAPVPAPRLTAQDEADLEAELAALRGTAEPADLAPQTDEDAPAPNSAEQRRQFEGEAADAALSRLMAQADEHLEGAESKRRLSAIAHLKAAVAATVAERKATGQNETKPEQPSRLARYRDDLAMVVRNKLGVPPAGTPQGERPAPLVLVSEQRIDRPRPVAMPNPAPAPGPVRPRRVTGATGLALAADDIDEDDDLAETEGLLVDGRGFAEFAARLGAKSLTEQLEAAGAYLACVEGRDQFTRPQLMQLAQTGIGSEIPREDGLRGFGTLLRTGRLTKVRRGQFALTDTSAYLAEGRRIAG